MEFDNILIGFDQFVELVSGLFGDFYWLFIEGQRLLNGAK